MNSQIEHKNITCPKCDSEDVAFSKKRQLYVCPDCLNEFTITPTTQPRIFISYARSDGEEFARNLCRRLVKEYGFSVWQDRAEMEGGKNWWQQIVEALKNEYIEYLVFVMTPAAMGSDTVRREWRLARQEGVCVVPVIASPDLDINTLPKWMRAPHFVNPDIPEQWTRFIRTLESPCNEQRVAFMVEDLPEDFVMRSREFDPLITNLLNKQQEEPVALTAALRGAGGYGKTVLAKAICHDERIQEEFFDGILWVTLGEKPGDLTKDVEDLIYVLSGERPGFANLETAVTWFVKLLDKRHILMVIDDVWNAAHLKPFLQGGSQCARLITTRNLDTLPSNAKKINVDAMQQNEATSLIGAGLPQGNEDALRKLASRLGEWPLLLKLVNGTLRHRVQDNNQEVPDALVYVNKALDKRGLTFFDARDAAARNQAVEKTLGVSTELLNPDECARYGELAIFPEDTDVPLATLEKLWNSTGGLDDFDTESLCDRFMRLSLLLNFDLTARHIRLHDVVRQYLIQKQSNKMPLLHNQLLDAYNPSENNISHWAELPVDEPYLWHHLAYHMVEANRNEDLRKLLFDFNWIQAKLEATDANSLIRDYDFLPDDENLQLVQDAIRLSAHVLVQDKIQLAGQLLGRLLFFQESNVQSMLGQACESKGYIWLRPLKTSLTPPGGPLIRTFEGHTHAVKGVAVMPDGKHAISASSDKTLRIWDIDTGKQVRILEGHAKLVNAIALTEDGRRAISASGDRTLRIWNIDTGKQVRTLEGHTDWVMSVDLMPDNRYAISASYDGSLKIWDIETGEHQRTLEGHIDSVNAVAVIPDGRRAISASKDHTLKVWDIETGNQLGTLEGHIDSVNAVAVISDGRRAISASKDHTLKVWDIEAEKELQILEDHTGSIWAVAVTPDGKHIISASEDKTLKIWDLGTVKQFKKIEGHIKAVRAMALTHDGKRAISASSDKTLIVWDIETGEQLKTLKGHTDWVNAVAVMQDNETAISASRDKLLIIWNIETGEPLRTLEGHTDSVTAVAIASDGMRAISASDDKTLIVWNIETGEPLRTLEGHTHAVNSVVIMQDGRCAISASLDKTLRQWDMESGAQLKLLKGHTGSVRAVAFEQDNRCTISASDDKTLIVWNIEKGEPLRTLEGHMDRVRSVALMPDGKRAISASYDNTLKVWDIETGKIVTSFNGDRDILTCAVSSDGLTIVAGDRIGRVHMLRLEGAN